MLKLVKYELIGSYRQYLLTFLIFLMGCVVLPLLPQNGISEMFIGFLMLAVVIIVISIFANIILSYNNSMFKKPGYLTLTLPVSNSQILISKVIGAVIWSSIASIILFLGVGILVFIMMEVSVAQIMEGLSIYWEQFISSYIWSILGQIVLTIAELIATILSLYFTVTFVHTRFVPKYKTIVGIVGYFVIVMLGGYFLSLPMVTDMLNKLDYTTFSALLFLVYIVLIIGFFCGTKYLMDTQIEVE